jgi:four helix bundle protein
MKFGKSSSVGNIWRKVRSENNLLDQRIQLVQILQKTEGRGSFQENRRFVKIARGSLRETQHWLRRAYNRNLLTVEQTEKLKPLIDKLASMLNAYLNSIGKEKETKDD